MPEPFPKTPGPAGASLTSDDEPHRLKKKPEKRHPIRKATTLRINEDGSRKQATTHSFFWHYPGDWLLGKAEGRLVSLFLIFLVLLLIASVAWLLCGTGVELLDETSGDSLAYAAWIAWGLLFDPGTQTGIPSDAPGVVKFVAALLSILGFIYFLTILGVVVDWIRYMLDHTAEVCSRVVDNNHTVILGWGNRTIYLIQELHAAYGENYNRVDSYWFGSRTNNTRRKRIVILADKPKLEAEREIAQYFSKGAGFLPHSVSKVFGRPSEIVYRQGDPTDWVELEKVSAFTADDIIILHDVVDGHGNDTRAVQCCLAINALKQKVTGEVFAEIQNPNNMGLVNAVHVTGVVLRRKSIRMACLQCLQPDVGEAAQEMLSFTSDHVWVIQMTEELQEKLQGESFWNVRMHYPEAVLIGTKTNDGDDDENDGSTNLIFISKKEPEYRPVDEASTSPAASAYPAQAHDSSVPHTSEPSHVDPPETLRDDGAREDDAAEHGCPEVVVVVGSPGDIQFHVQNLWSMTASRNQKLELHIMWSRPGNPAIASVEKFVRDHKQAFIHVLSLPEQDITERQLTSPIGQLTSPSGQDSQPAEWPGQPASPSGQRDGELKLHWYHGGSTNTDALTSLPLKSASRFLVLPYTKEEGEPAATSDARSLTTVFQLRQMLGRLGRTSTSTPIVCELWDIRSKTIVNNPTFRQAASFFHSVQAETALLATAADDSRAFNVLMYIIEDNGINLSVIKARELGLETAPGSTEDDWDNYWTLTEKIKQKRQGDVLIGWKKTKRQDGYDDGLGYGIWQVNPQNKERKFDVDGDMSFLILNQAEESWVQKDRSFVVPKKL